MLVDTLLAGVLVVLMVTGIDPAAPLLATVLAALSAAPIAVRRSAPMAALVMSGLAHSGSALLGHGDSKTSGIGVLVGVFSVAMYRPRRVAAAGWLIGVAVLAVDYVVVSDTVPWSEVGLVMLQLTAAWALGESTRNWARRAEQARQAVVDERRRIARELHDVVAHHMSVVSLQAGVAEYVFDSDRDTARQALTDIGGAAREALGEMRRLLDVLRTDDQDTDYAPQPGLADLDALVARVRDAGLALEYEITGVASPLPAGPDLCAYRVAQESLTNVLKHAGRSNARLTLDYGKTMLTLNVTDDGSGSSGHRSTGEPGRRGIIGMRERAELYDGVLTAGPRPEGGFSVTVRLPL
ncbi:sensor histidine kinase [Amycolatopsis sp. NPDC051071]|uniref:sensor histidine kinase n=1 Tax=Amycolatopsis sp. NPDC051071 TaxID=3154637 RepID=UPI0034285B62